MTSDDELQKNVLDELHFDPQFTASDVAVTVEDGVVTLRGAVTSYAEKLVAEHAVKRISGVHFITDELRVDLLPSHRRSDQDIAKAAIDALSWNVDVPHESITVSVQNGWLTLQGEVEWHFSIDNAKRTVQYLIGIRGLTSRIVVKQPLPAQDFKAKLLQAFKRNAEINPDQIDIDICDGNVTLRGTVRSWEEYDDATRAAYSLPGVEHVENLTRVSS